LPDITDEEQLLIQRVSNLEELIDLCTELRFDEPKTELALNIRGFPVGDVIRRELDPLHLENLTYYNHYLRHISNEMGPSVSRSVDTSVKATWRRLCHRTTRNSDTNYGLVVGRIQSGKTAHMLGLSAMFVSNHYDTVIIFSGTIEDLRTQTLERIEGINFPESIIVCPKGDDLTQNQDAQASIAAHLDARRTRNKLIIIIKKNPSQINCIRTLISNSGAGLSRRRVLIIDDECDHASRDRNYAEARERPLMPEEISETNKSIRTLLIELRRSISPTWYIGYTATPFANLLQQEDSSTEDDEYGLSLYPRNFIHCLTQPTNHIDNEYYFLEENDNVKIYDEPTHQNYSNTNFTNLIYLHVTSQLLKQIREINMPHITLVHTDISTQEHEAVINNINQIKNRIIGCDIQVIKRTLLATITRYYRNIPRSQRTEFNNKVEQFDSNRLKRVFRRIELIELNRRDGEQEFDDEEPEIQFRQELLYPIPNFSAIVIGGTRVSRGLTLKGLTLTWFSRETREPSYDTRLQQARWCGYRVNHGKSYSDLVRIFTTEVLEQQFQTIALAERDLRNQLENYDDDTDPVEERIFIQRHEGFSITGRMPPRLGQPEIMGEIAERNTICQYPSIFRVENPIEINERLFDNFFELYRSDMRINTPPPNPIHSGYQISSGVQKRDVRIFLQNYLDSYPGDDDVVTKIKLEQIIRRLDNPEVTSLDRWNIGLRVPTRNPRIYRHYAINFNLVERGFTSDGYAGRVWSGTQSASIDLQEGETRSVPLLLLYLSDYDYEIEGRRSYPENLTRPVVLFHIIIPGEALGEGTIRDQRFRNED
jgi:hypothetical protein